MFQLENWLLYVVNCNKFKHLFDNKLFKYVCIVGGEGYVCVCVYFTEVKCSIVVGWVA